MPLSPLAVIADRETRLTQGPHSTNLSSHKGINPSRGPRARRKHTFGRAKKHVSAGACRCSRCVATGGCSSHNVLAANGVPGPKYNRKGTFGREAAPGDLKYPPKWDRPDVRNYLGPRLACGAGSKAVRARAAFGSTVPRSKRHVVSEADFNAPGKGISQFHVRLVWRVCLWAAVYSHACLDARWEAYRSARRSGHHRAPQHGRSSNDKGSRSS